jgi:hypothetical protein
MQAEKLREQVSNILWRISLLYRDLQVQEKQHY